MNLNGKLVKCSTAWYSRKIQISKTIVLHVFVEFFLKDEPSPNEYIAAS